MKEQENSAVPTSVLSSARNWSIIRYTSDMRDVWDRLVRTSANGTFLLTRDYMEYHSDRFSDYSLIVLKDGDPFVLLPANLTSDGVLHSHQGLTYGGWVVPCRHFDGNDMLEIFSLAADYCRHTGICAIDYKPIPWIYTRQPAQDDLYALFRHNARLTECNLSCTIDLSANPGFNKLQTRHLRKAISSGAVTGPTEDTDSFWAMLMCCLEERHEAVPVHTVQEMKLLQKRFPENIRLFVSTLHGEMHAGVCIYDTGLTAHCQYIATTETGRRLGLLTLLMDYLIHDIYSHRRYFDFGTSNEHAGLTLNNGLLRQKSSLGGSGVAYQRWLINL
ncbi:MAG: GNAT family N-acetyltransferase [Muribaculaceae bacterium]|nr:GNAT family N-acetyltransferase [Muribaculaceae bacterium]